MEVGDQIEVKVHDSAEESPLAKEVLRLTEAREKLQELPERPDPVEVEEARKSILLIDNTLKEQLEELWASPCPPGQDLDEWRLSQVL